MPKKVILDPHNPISSLNNETYSLPISNFFLLFYIYYIRNTAAINIYKSKVEDWIMVPPTPPHMQYAITHGDHRLA